MEFRQLEYFVAVAEDRHFTKAANRMHVAQSGLSASIRALERELGAALFIRSTRRVELTDAGRALLVEAKQTLGNVAAARDAVAAVQGLLRGSVAIGTIQCLGPINLSAALADFHTEHEGVEIRVRQAASTELMDQVRSGDLDLAFVATPPRLDGQVHGVSIDPLYVEPMILSCGPNHPLAARSEVKLADLHDETFVDFYPGWVTRDVTDAALADAGVNRRVAFEVNDVHSLLDFCANGLGVAIVPETFRKKRTSAHFVRLADPRPTWCVGLATGTGRRPSAATQALLAGNRLATFTGGSRC